MSSPIYDELAQRLGKFNPPIKLEQHIASDDRGNSTLQVTNTILDGINFKVKNRKALEDAISRAADPASGERAFAGNSHEDQSHWALKLSMAATVGTGFRQIWRFPNMSLSDRPLSFEDRFDADFVNFGNSLTIPDITSLHWGITDDWCNVHVDNTGFVLETWDGNLGLTPDFLQHILNELVLKTKLKGVAPPWAKKAIDRISLVWLDSEDNFNRAGPQIKNVPLLRDISKLPGIGRILGEVPLPGISVDLSRGKNYRLRVVATCGIHGDCSSVIDFSGTHNIGGG